MPLRILYFAWVRERIGLDGETVAPPDEVIDVASLIGWLAGRSEAHAAALKDRARIRAAVDDQFATPETGIAGAREVALFPPVTGG
ncbi:molybdopterin converting factor subunit 1 [Sphingomonas sp. AP4-R1]|uniref:molybdopterin converting factor subunit 1 n=1 Tax=Sphingomonas sp. AP4-R1 TaxID=2735134 RepID=UPI00149345DF|nr:molybdopterin converting factor subunit 1 [Sphingomonas sp. AP4-R1]QJU59576.1 molybdopterin converting factor subunit 1 [Sphingomonas sp. AP4-R1]